MDTVSLGKHAMALQNFGPTASAADVAAATLQDGAAIVSGLVHDYARHYREQAKN